MSTTFTKKLLLTGTALVALSMAGIGQAHALDITVAGPIAADPAADVVFKADVIATVASGISITGNVTNDTDTHGTLTFAGGNSGVTGTVGAGAAPAGAINAINLGVAGSTTTFGNTVNAGAISFSADGAGVFNGDTTISGVTALGAGTLSIGSSRTFTATGGITGSGVLNLGAGAGAVIGAASTVATLNSTGTGASTITGALTATNTNISGGGSLAATTSSLGTVTFGAGGGSVAGTGITAINAAADFTGNAAVSSQVTGATVTTTAGGNGTITVSHPSSTLGVVNLATDTGLTFSGPSITSVAGTGTLNLSGGSAQAIGATQAANINLTGAGAKTFNSTVGTTGTLSSTGADNVITGALTANNVTVSGNKLTVSGAASTVSGATEISSGATLDFAGTSLNNVTGAGTLNLNGTTGTQSVGVTTAANITLSGAAATTFSSTVATTGLLSSTGADNTITGALTANNVTVLGNKLTVSGAASTVSGATEISSGATLDFAGTSLNNVTGAGTLNLNGTDAAGQTVGTIEAATLSMTGAGAKTLNGVVTATNINIGSNVQANENLNGAINFTTDSTLTMAAGKSITGAVTTGTGGNGNITFGGGVTIGHSIGVAGTGLKDVTFTAGENSINSSIYANTINLGSGIANLNTVTLRGNVTAAATTNIGDKQVTVDGQFHTTNQTLNYSVNSAATAGMVTVRGADGTGTGTVHVATGTKVNVTVNTSEYIAQNQEYVLIGGGTGGAVQMLDAADLRTNNTALLTFKQKADTNSLIVYADRTAMNATAKDKNSASVGAMLDQVGGGGDAAVKDLQIRLGAMGTAAEVEATLATLVPDLSGGAVASTVNTSNMTGGVVSGRVNALRSGDNSYGTGVASGNMLESGHIWAQGFGSTADQDRRDGVAGYDADTVGMVFGVDTDITDSIRAGIALAYANTDVNSDNASRTDTDIDSYQVTVYGGMDLANNYFVNGQLAYLYNDIDTTRYNVGGIAGNTARADFHSNQYVARAELGRDFAMDHGITLTPSALVNYNYVDTSSYTEKGAGGLGLSNVRSDDMHILEFGVNMMGSADFNDGHGGLVTPNLHAGYRYDVIGDSVATTAGLVGAGNAAFKTEGFEPSQHTVNVGTGIKWSTANNLDLSINYDYEHKSDYDAHSGYVRAGFKF